MGVRVEFDLTIYLGVITDLTLHDNHYVCHQPAYLLTYKVVVWLYVITAAYLSHISFSH